MIRRFLSLSQTERDAIYEQESINATAQQHCSDRLTLLSSDNTLVSLQKQEKHIKPFVIWCSKLHVSGRSCLRKIILSVTEVFSHFMSLATETHSSLESLQRNNVINIFRGQIVLIMRA